MHNEFDFRKTVILYKSFGVLTGLDKGPQCQKLETSKKKIRNIRGEKHKTKKL